MTPSEEKEFVIEEATADPAAADREAALQSLSNKLKSPVAERPALSASLGSSHLPNGTPFNVTWLAQRHGSSLYDLLRDAPTDFPAMVDSLSDARSGTLVATIDGTVIGYAHFASPTPYVNFEYFVDQHRYEYSAVALARLEINPAFKEFQAPLQDSLQKALSVSAHHCGYKAVAWEQRPAAGEDISWTLAPVHSGPVRAPAAGSVHAS